MALASAEKDRSPEVVAELRITARGIGKESGMNLRRHLDEPGTWISALG